MKGNAYIPFMRRKGDGSTLNLDFTKMSALDSRFTFSRTSSATYINSAGYVAFADSNMLLQSESLATLPWNVQNGATVANVSLTNPIGGATSTQITSGMAYNSVYQNLTFGAAGAHTLSIWVRSGTSTRLNIGIYSGASFVTGTISVISGSATVSGTDFFTVTNLTSTWTRLQIVYTTLSGGALFIYPDTGASPAAGLTIYAWGAQLNQGSTAQTYYQTTTAAYYAPRFEYDPTTLAAKGLLIEGNATNLQRYSQTFVTGSSIWYDTQGSISEGVPGDAPDGTSPSYIFYEPSSGTGAGQLQINGSSASLAASTTYTVSFWAKAGTRSKVLWRCDGGGKDVGFNLSTGVATVVAGTFTNTRMTAYLNGMYRCEATWANVNASGFPGIYIATGTGTTYTTSYTCDGSNVELWGFQLETGSGASSYIPTTTGQATRNPDLALMTSTNFSNWFSGGTTGTFFVDWHGGVRGITSTIRTVISTDDLSTKHLHLQQASAAGVLKVADFGAAHSVSTANTITSGARTKGAYSFAYPGTGLASTVNLCLNGGTVATSTAIAFSVAPTWLVLGGSSTTGTTLTDLTTVLNGSIRQIKYYPTALTSAQLIAMTT